jgi:hypothetical protein
MFIKSMAEVAEFEKVKWERKRKVGKRVEKGKARDGSHIEAAPPWVTGVGFDSIRFVSLGVSEECLT